VALAIDSDDHAWVPVRTAWRIAPAVPDDLNVGTGMNFSLRINKALNRLEVPEGLAEIIVLAG
jgi:hypothetical protein